MKRGWHGRLAASRPWLGQLVVGLVALPLSALPFVGYTALTPEGRLVRDRALVALWPPSLPKMAPSAAAAAAPRYDGAVMALAYHGIGSASDGDGGFVVSPKRFGEHLATLRAAGMRTVTAAQVAKAFEGGRPLPPKAVMISFDDGRSDAMMFADPLLKEAGMRATMFVITGAAEDPGIYYASWDKLEGYARSGRWDLQAHTDSLHREQKVPGGRRLPALTSLASGESLAEFRVRVRTDFGRASEAIERHVGRAPVAFAYPFGAYGAERANDPRIRNVLREEVKRRYALAFHQDEQDTVPLAVSDDDRLGLRRLEVEDWSGAELLQRIKGAVRRTPGQVPGEGQVPADAPDRPAMPPPTAEPQVGTTSPSEPTSGTARPRLASVPAPRVTVPRVTVPPAPVPTTGLPPAVTAPVSSPTTALPPPDTVPPATSPATTTPTTTPTTTTTPPPTPSVPPTTVPPGCRSHGQGNSCRPKGG